MSTEPASLILWDIDKTLVDVSVVSREIYTVAFEKVVGRPLRELPAMAGRTEHAILSDTLALNGVPRTKFGAFYEALGAAADSLVSRMRQVGRALPGARESIAVFRRSDVVQSVATGNIRQIAETKLRAFDLAEDLDLEVGGYGSDGEARDELVRLAIERASSKYGVELSPEQVVVIGDTKLDVEAAHAAGASAVAVATGEFSTDELERSGADAVVVDLTSPVALADVVFTLLLSRRT